jgi:hypothetical protein
MKRSILIPLFALAACKSPTTSEPAAAPLVTGSGTAATQSATTGSATTTAVVDFADSRTITIGETFGYTCAITRDHGVACWQPTIDVNKIGDEQRIAGLDNVIAVAVAGKLTFALHKTGNVSFWNFTLQGLTDATDLVAGRTFCALRKTGAVACWGDRDGLGNGDASVTTVPTKIDGL